MSGNKSQIKIREEVYGEIAVRYIERYGAELQRELSERKQRSPFGDKRYDRKKTEAGQESAAARQEHGETGWTQGEAGRTQGETGRTQGEAGMTPSVGGVERGGGWLEVGEQTPSGAQTPRGMKLPPDAQTFSKSLMSGAQTPPADGHKPVKAQTPDAKTPDVKTQDAKTPPEDEIKFPGAHTHVSEAALDAFQKTPAVSGGVEAGPITVSADAEDRIIRALDSERRKNILIRIIAAAALLACLTAVYLTADIGGRAAAVWDNAAGFIKSLGAPDPARNYGDRGEAGATTARTSAATAQSTASGNTSAGGDEPAEGDALIPAGFQIKPEYTVVGTAVDGGRSVYFITDEKNENIVMSLRRGSIPEPAVTHMKSVVLGAVNVYLLYDADYSMALFQKDGVVYELTCRFDVNGLLEFCGFGNPGFSRGALKPQIAAGGSVRTIDAQISDIPLKTETASYIETGYNITNGVKPRPGAVITEEIMNYFPPIDSGQPGGDGNAQFAAYAEIGPSPFHKGRAAAYIRVKTGDLDWGGAIPTNLTILLDTSSSMYSFDKLPVLTNAILQAAAKLNDKSGISVLTYGGGSEILLDGAAGKDTAALENALADLETGAASYEGPALEAAYSLAKKNGLKDGYNLIVVFTDTDDTEGLTDKDGIEALIAANSGEGVDLLFVGAGAACTMKGAPAAVRADSVTAAREVLLNAVSRNQLLVADRISALIEFNPMNISAYNLIGFDNTLTDDPDQLITQKDAELVCAGDEIALLYELTLTKPLPAQPEQPEQPAGAAGANAGADLSNELFEIRIYKPAGDGYEVQYVKTVKYDDVRYENSADFNLACSVAAFCEVMRGRGALNADIDLAESLAEAGLSGGKTADGNAAGGNTALGNAALGNATGNERHGYLDLIKAYRVNFIDNDQAE